MNLFKLDMTKGSIIKGLLLFMVPLLIGNIFQQLYSIVDAIIVGQVMGQAALTGVNCTGSASFFIIGFASGLTGGLAIPIAQYFGAKDKVNLKKAVAMSLVVSLIIGVVLTAIGLAICGPMLVLLKTDTSIFDYAYDYLFTIFAGLICTIFYNMATFILRSLGDSTTPLIALIVAALFNVGGDYLFVAVFNLGTVGAALATVLSNLLAAIISFIVLFARFKDIRLKFGDLIIQKNDVPLLLYDLKISLPLAFQNSIIGIGLLVQQGAVNSLGVIPGAFQMNPAGEMEPVLYSTAYGNAGKIDSFSNCIILAIGTTMSTFCGQNYGSRDLKRIKKGLIQGMLMGLVTVAILAAILIPLTPYISLLFSSNQDPLLLEATQFYMMIDLLFYALLVTLYILRSSLQGLGKTVITMIVGAIELLMRIGAALLLSHLFGWTGLCFSNPAAWIVSDLVLIPAMIIAINKFTKEDLKGEFGLKSLKRKPAPLGNTGTINNNHDQDPVD